MKYMIWAIDPRNKPGMSELREALSSGGDTFRSRRRTGGYSTDKNGSLGIIPIKESLYTSDYLRFSAQIEELNADNEVGAILLDVNSPGGIVNGAIECASIIAKSKKPVYAYIEGMGCSAAYLLASAAKSIHMSPSSITGSIGVQGSWTNYEGLLAKLGVQKVYFQSQFSSNKNLSPATDEGKKSIKKELDETWAIFAASIAKNRGITVDQLVEKYGQGSTFLAAEAQERGLIDGIVDDFGACVELIKPQMWGGGEGMAQEFTTVEALTAAYPTLVAQIKRDERKAGVDEGVAGERVRAEAVLGLSKHTTDIGLLTKAVKEGLTTEAVMVQILDAQQQVREKAAKDAQAALQISATESKDNIVRQGTLPGDGMFTTESNEKARIDEICANMKKNGGGK